MAGSKKKQKRVPSNMEPQGKKVVKIGGNPDSIMKTSPSWRFSSADNSGPWPFSQERIQPVFWDKIYPYLRGLESQTWAEIGIKDKKQNHTIPVGELNKCARDRLEDIQLELVEVYSLRIDGKTRLYGYRIGSAFVILWYDIDHGDNDTCVCRSRQKRT